MKTNMHLRNTLFLAERYRQHMGLTLATVSQYATKRGSYLAEISSGERRKMTADRYQAVLCWFSTNWPEDLEWPADIPRPTAAEAQADG